MTTLHTTPPGKYVLIYDGLCKFCTAGSPTFVRWMGRVETELLDFQPPGALDRFPGLTHDACMRAMQLVTPDGRVYAGAEAVARAFATRPRRRPAGVPLLRPRTSPASRLAVLPGRGQSLPHHGEGGRRR